MAHMFSINSAMSYISLEIYFPSRQLT